ncbi:MAG: group III truncated hemoglobin [Fimbriimonadaceae bacterium]|nr:group III truncated hemoglobin [Chitinophagales bacterium]
MRDIENKADIKIIIDSFYDKVKTDELIGHIFNDIANVNWEHHLPIMYDFWDFAILSNGTYARNVMTPHFALNEKIKLLPEHFGRWIKLFNETIDALFSGENSEAMKKRAHIIAETLKYKLGEKNKLNII